MRRMITEKEAEFFKVYAQSGAISKYAGATIIPDGEIEEWSGLKNISDYMKGTTIKDNLNNVIGVAINFNGAVVTSSQYAMADLVASNVTIRNLTVMNTDAFLGHISSTKVTFDNVKFIGRFNGFIYSDKLTDILGWADVSGVTSYGGFTVGVSALKRLQFKHFRANFDISGSTAWTTDSLVEIIDNLDDTGSAHTLNMGTTNLAKLSEAQKKVATSKGWNLA